MILADKIIALRKKAGWSQEELGEKLGVTRQSVSKWEGAQSVPDMDKILQLSRLFGVTTDYLLKDELGEPEYTAEESSVPALHRVSMEEASEYLSLRRAAAPKMALATLLCVICPVVLLVLAGLSDGKMIALSENAASGIGLCVLMLLVATGVGMYLSCSARAREFDFLEKEPFETEYGVDGMVRERRKAFKNRRDRLILLGTMLCILPVVPLFLATCFETADLAYILGVCALLGLAGCGAACFVYQGTIQSSMDKLLEEGDFTPEEKKHSGVMGRFTTIYWLVATAIFLVLNFTVWKGNYKDSWVLWAVAGVLYGAVMGAIRLIMQKSDT